MLNYERIKAIIESGCMAEMKEWNWFIIFSSITSKWNIRHSDWYNSIEDCMDELWIWCEDEKEVNSRVADYIRPIGIKPPVLKVGDMVEILEVARECGDYDEWNDDRKEMVWKWPFEIINVFDDSLWISYWFSYNTYTIVFLHYEVCLWTGDREPETIEIEWKKYLRSDIEKLNSI